MRLNWQVASKKINSAPCISLDPYLYLRYTAWHKITLLEKFTYWQTGIFKLKNIFVNGVC